VDYGSSSCSQCGAGKVTTSAGQASCQACDDMSIPNQAQTACTACGDNEVPDPDTQKTTCISCEVGESAQKGSCIKLAKCSPGEFSQTGYGPVCEACPAGRYISTSGAKGDSSDAACLVCPYGTYTESLGSPFAKDCLGTEYTAKEGSDRESLCLECPDGEVPNAEKSGCMQCPDGEYASKGVCLKDVGASSSEAAIGGVLSNNGTPFYVMAIMVVLIGGLGFAVHGSKKGVDDVLLFTAKEHVLQFALPSAGLLSELILAVAIANSGNTEITIIAVMLFFSRFVVAVLPGLVVAFVTLTSSPPQILNDGLRGKSLKYFLNIDVVLENSQLYLLLLFFALFEPPMLSYMPWYASDFYKSSKFPTLALMRVTYVAKVLQLVVTLVAQVGLLVKQQPDGSTLSTIIIMNVAMSSVMVAFKGSEMLFKIGLLGGTAKSIDSEAAQWAYMTGSSKGRPKDGGGGGDDVPPALGGMGLAAPTSYVSNPLHFPASTAAVATTSRTSMMMAAAASPVAAAAAGGGRRASLGMMPPARRPSLGAPAAAGGGSNNNYSNSNSNVNSTRRGTIVYAPSDRDILSSVNMRAME
jgi:hypothetical protein